MKGLLYVVTAPSGAGKTTLIKSVLGEIAGLDLSVSFTTRPPRDGERDGREYHFVDRSTFDTMLVRGEFLESAEVHGNRYGTSQRVIDRTLEAGRDLLLEIDWQGAEQVRRLYPDCISTFILPPSIAELERRMRARALDAPEVIARRLTNAQVEISHAPEFDYVIINKEFDTARRDLMAVILAERLRTGRQLTQIPDLTLPRG